MGSINLSSNETWENKITNVEDTDRIVESTDRIKKDINAILLDKTIILPKERYSSIDYIITLTEWAKKKIFSSHIKFSSEAIKKMKADPFMKHEHKWENLLFSGDEVELSWVLYPPIEYEIQEDELSYIIYDNKRIFDKTELSIEADSFKVETEEEQKS